MIIGIVSGYWNPLHYGHIEYINAAKKLCDYLIAIVNNDEQVKVKGSIPFMDELHRTQIVANLKAIDWVFLSRDKDKTVCETLQYIKNCYSNALFHLKFFNSGDRIEGNLPGKEAKTCALLGIEQVVIPLPKIYSSSDLIKKATNE